MPDEGGYYVEIVEDPQVEGVYVEGQAADDAAYEADYIPDTTALELVMYEEASVVEIPASEWIEIVEAGPRGPAGGPGPQGDPGSQLYTAAGAPLVGLGIDGDLYVDTVAPSTFYRKEGGVWVAKGTLQGVGSQILSGAAAPASGVGAVGDFFFLTVAPNTVYKKTAPTVWTSQANIQGAAGGEGPAGPQGDQGIGIRIMGQLSNSSLLPPTPSSPEDAWVINTEVWTWDGDSWVNAGFFAPSQSTGAKMSRRSTTPLTSASGARAVVFDTTERASTEYVTDPATGRITVPFDGFYMVALSVRLASTTTSSLQVWVNRVSPDTEQVRGPLMDGDSQNEAACSGVMYLLAGEVIQANLSTGASTQITGEANGHYTTFSVASLGPGRGPQGIQGDPGTDGASGEKWFSGAGAPAGGTGDVGDWYLDTDSGDVYEKTGVSTWTQAGNLKGPQGVAGVLLLDTDTDPVPGGTAVGTIVYAKGL